MRRGRRDGLCAHRPPAAAEARGACAGDVGEGRTWGQVGGSPEGRALGSCPSAAQPRALDPRGIPGQAPASLPELLLTFPTLESAQRTHPLLGTLRAARILTSSRGAPLPSPVCPVGLSLTLDHPLLRAGSEFADSCPRMGRGPLQSSPLLNARPIPPAHPLSSRC